MDPVNALGIAAATVQFVDFSTKLISKSHEIYTSTNGELVEESSRRAIAEWVLELNGEIKKSCEAQKRSGALSETERDLWKICEECDVIARDLLAALKRLNTGNAKPSKWKSFRHALESIWSREDMERMEKRLDSYRQQLMMHALVSLREHQTQLGGQMGFLKNLALANNTNGQRFLQYLEQNELYQREIIQAIRRDPKPVSPKLATENALQQFQNQILQNLYFRHIKTREQRVPKAHEKTFEWVFHHPQVDQPPWADFIGWLQDQSAPQLYWITGKAGAGKSTLMKMICNDKRTKSLLRKWADGRRLVQSNFYFWNSGVHLQMSQEGLLRSLLFEALEQCPELIHRCFPDRWELYSLVGVSASEHLSQVDLQNGLVNLVKSREAMFAFFIDGLDEFVGDHNALVAFIQHLSEVGKENAKICVSSRPWVVFEDAFGRQPSLRLEDLTYPDFVRFVEFSFKNSFGYNQLLEEGEPRAHKLMQGIAKKASGVFLWLSLVVRSLLVGVADGERLSDLQRRLEALPPDLEDLFHGMLDSIGEERIGHAAQIFDIVHAARTPITLLRLSFADESDPEEPFSFPISHVTRNEEDARVKRMRRRLNSHCKGLLEANYVEPTYLVTVEYLHRTVKDFLRQEEVRAKLASKVPLGFNANFAHCQAYLMRLKCANLPTGGYQVHVGRFEDSTEESLFGMILWFVQYADYVDKETGSTPIRLFHELAKTIEELIRQKGCCNTIGCWCRGALDHPDGPFLPLAIALQILPYLQWRFNQMPFAMQEDRREESYPAFHFALSPSEVIGSVGVSDGRPACNIPGPSGALVKLLMDHGADPKLSLPGGNTPLRSYLKSDYRHPGIIKILSRRRTDVRVFLGQIKVRLTKRLKRWLK